MVNKILISIIVAVAIFAVIEVSHSQSRRNDLIVGYVNSSDVFLYNQTVNVTGRPGQLQTYFVSYNGTRNITRIRAIDNFLNNTGGFASIVNGGLGQRNVTLRLISSAIGRGFNFFIDIYGR